MTRSVRGLGTEARETSEAAVAGVVGPGLINGGVATMPEVGVAGFSFPLTLAEGVSATAEAILGGISILDGFWTLFPAFPLSSDVFEDDEEVVAVPSLGFSDGALLSFFFCWLIVREAFSLGEPRLTSRASCFVSGPRSKSLPCPASFCLADPV